MIQNQVDKQASNVGFGVASVSQSFKFKNQTNNNIIQSQEQDRQQHKSKGRQGELTKTLSKLFRDQYMETFEIGRGKPKPKKKSTTQIEIEEAFNDDKSSDAIQEDLDEDRQDSEHYFENQTESKLLLMNLINIDLRQGSSESQIGTQNQDFYNEHSQTATKSFKGINLKKDYGQIEENLKDIMAFKTKHNIDTNLRKEKQKKMKKKAAQEKGTYEEELYDHDGFSSQSSVSIEFNQVTDGYDNNQKDSFKEQTPTPMKHPDKSSYYQKNLGHMLKISFLDTIQHKKHEINYQKSQQLIKQQQQEYFNSKEWMKNLQIQKKRFNKTQYGTVSATNKSSKDKKLLTQTNFKDYLQDLMMDDKIIQQLQNKTNLQQIVIQMSQNQPETNNKNRPATLGNGAYSRQSVQNRNTILQSPSLKNYFIKKEFISNSSRIKNGMSTKLTKNDIKTYLLKHQKSVALMSQLGQINGQTFDHIVHRFFSKSKANYQADEDDESHRTVIPFALRQTFQKESATNNEEFKIDGQPYKINHQFSQKNSDNKLSMFNISRRNGSIGGGSTYESIDNQLTQTLPQLNTRILSAGEFETVNKQGHSFRTLTFSPNAQQQTTTTAKQSTDFQSCTQSQPSSAAAFRHKQFVSTRGGLKDNHFMVSAQFAKFNPPLILGYKNNKKPSQGKQMLRVQDILKGKGLIQAKTQQEILGLSQASQTINRRFKFL